MLIPTYQAIKEFPSTFNAWMDTLQKRLYKIQAYAIGNWEHLTVGAAAAYAAIYLTGSTTNTEVAVPYMGRITGIGITSDSAIAAGSITADVTINGTVQSLDCVVDTTNTLYNTSTPNNAQNTELLSFDAGDLIGVHLKHTGLGAAYNINVTVFII